MLSGHRLCIWDPVATPRKHAASKRTACFRGDAARAMLLGEIRESMAPSKPKDVCKNEHHSPD